MPIVYIIVVETLSCGSVHYVRHGRNGKLNVKFIYYYYYYSYYLGTTTTTASTTTTTNATTSISYNMRNKLILDWAVINFERSVCFGQAFEKGGRKL